MSYVPSWEKKYDPWDIEPDPNLQGIGYDDEEYDNDTEIDSVIDLSLEALIELEDLEESELDDE